MQLRRALAFSYLEKYGSYVIGLASTVVISRLLGPADIGVFAVGMAIVGIVAVVRELGISTYIVQEDDLTPERVRAAFTLALIVGLCLAVVVLLGSVPAGRYYGDPRVTQVVAILALGFVLVPFGSISQALLSRELKFGTLTWIRLLHASVQGGVGAALAWGGFGPVSLAWASVAAAAVNALVSFAACPHSCRPVRQVAELRRVLSVGGPATVIAIVDDILSAIPELVLGRVQNLGATGLLSRARGLSQMAHQLIARAAGPVFFAAFSARRREGQDVEALYSRATICVTTLGWSMLAGMAVLAEPLVEVLFGRNWADVVPLVRWLCVSAGVALLTSGANHLLMATGAIGSAMRAKLWSVPAYVICVLLGAMHGAQALCIALVIGTLVSSAILANAIRADARISVRTQLVPLRFGMPVVAATVMGALPSWLVGVNSLGSAALSLALGTAGGATAALLALVVMARHPLRAEVIQAWGQMRGARG